VLKVVFCEVFSTAYDSASIISIVLKWRLSVLSSIWETKKSAVREDDSHAVFSQKFPDEKGSVRQCVVMMQQLVLLSPKFGANSLHIFTQST
jgi:hypothetical protein